ncbi:MAG: hypothetical protein ACXWFS_02785 [Thermoanaerobaculia bacterium]
MLVLAALLAPLRAEASLTKTPAAELAAATPPPRTLAPEEPPVFSLGPDRLAGDAPRLSLFVGDELARAAAESERAPSFHPLAAVSFLSQDASLDLASALESRFQKTRIGVFDFLGSRIIGVERELSLELQWGSGRFGLRTPEGIGVWLSQDPLGDRDSPNLYGFVGMRPHEKTDPLGLLGLSDVPGIAWDTFTGVFDPQNAWKNTRRGVGGAVGAGKFVGKTVVGAGSLVIDVATMSVDDAAADRMVARGQGVWAAVSHPLDAVVSAHSDAFNKILEHEQKGEYFSSGAEAGELGVADAAAIYGGATAARSLLRAARTATARGVLQRVTTTTNARLAANPALAQEVLSDAEYAAGQASKRVAPMQYGNALERMVAERVQESRILGRLYEHVGGPSNPDFIGRGIFEGLNLDITTPRSVRAHLARPGYGPGLLISKYQRPAGFSLFPAAP